MTGKHLSLFVVAGEESGDRLAADLVAELSGRHTDIELEGVGGDALKAAGLTSLFEMDEISLMGITAVVARLPSLLKRIKETARAAVATKPDAVLLVDAPDFNLRVAKRIRAADPSIPIIKWVSPSVWAWRPGRAAAMKPHIDHLLALLPFEPAVHRELGGPPCTYTGHPLFSRRDELRPGPDERASITDADPPILVVLPGSRRQELNYHGEAFGRALQILAEQGVRFRAIIPTLERLENDVRDMVANWSVEADIVTGEAARFAVFRQAQAALAASGTVTLELAISGVPTVVGYKGNRINTAIVTYVIRIWSVVLANLVLGRPVMREYLGELFQPQTLAAATKAMLTDTPERRAQIESLRELDTIMETGDKTPAATAADALLATIEERRAEYLRA